MNIFEFFKKPYSLRINSQFRPEDPKDKTYGIETFEINMAQNLFPNEFEAIT